MKTTDLPLTQDLVLIGGGHTHALVLQAWAKNPLPGVRVTLINPGATAPYSGMLPGFVAGHYERDALDIDLVRLARRAGARLVLGAASALDPAARVVTVPGRAKITYDIASIDVGITSAMDDLEGFAEHGVPAKPLGAFATRWSTYRSSGGRARVAVIGAGVAGAELAMAMAFALKTDGRPADLTLIDRGKALAVLGARARDRILTRLTDLGVSLRENAGPCAVSATGITLEDGSFIAADFVTGAAGTRPYPWLAATGLTDDSGFIPVDQRLRSQDSSVFAVGDCASMTATPRPKAGVFAVRQAPVLFANLRAALSGAGGMRPYIPQSDYLKLISLGSREALAEKSGITVSGRAMWHWKDRIDRAFMDQFDHALRPFTAPLPWPRARGMARLAETTLCGGCGSKVGGASLRKGLGDLPGIGDDAALLQTGDTRQVITTDHLRAFCEDPVLMAQIAATHALGDVWAMGAKPQAAVMSLVLPRQSPQLAARWLTEVTQAARKTLEAAGATLVGGHTTQGAEMTLGFTVTGVCDAAPITLGGAYAGDGLILTKPLGSGVLMAAEMQGKAQGADIASAWDLMTQSQANASRILVTYGARAMTDVTGFGLIGHLTGMCHASGVDAEIDLGAIPIMSGARTVSQLGIRSSLFPENALGFEDIAQDPHAALLFDPQTAGGLLAALPDAQLGSALEALHRAGYSAALIGRVSRGSGKVSIRSA